MKIENPCPKSEECNSYLLDGKILIDAPFDCDSDRYSDVEAVIITYSHETHTASIKKCEEDTKVYSPRPDHWETTNYAEGRDMVKVEDGKSIEIVDEKLRVLKEGEYIGIYVPEEKVLFSGDMFPIPTENRDQERLEKYIRGIRRIQELEVKEIYPAHSEPITDNVDRRIKREIEKAKANKEQENL